MNTDETEAIDVFTKRFPNSEIKVVDANHLEVDGLDIDRVDEKWVVSQINGYYDDDTGWEMDHEDLGAFESLSMAIGCALIEAVKHKVSNAQENILNNVSYMEESVYVVSSA